MPPWSTERLYVEVIADTKTDSCDLGGQRQDCLHVRLTCRTVAFILR